MNLVSTMVGLSIMGAAAPSMMTMSLAPHEAQLRAKNLGAAESAAVTFAAANEGASQLTGDAPDGCELASLPNSAYEITCTKGEDTKYVQSVTRAFRLIDCDNDGNNGHGNSGGNDCSNPGGNTTRTFPNQIPSSPITPFSFQCTSPDHWGLNWTKSWPTLDQCVPQVAWDRDMYFASDPDDWLWDINNVGGHGPHPDY